MMYLIIAITIIIVVRYIVFTVKIESNSMYPSLRSGNLKFAYNKLSGNYQRGDVLIFYSEEHSKDLVKRLIGLPGDRIDIQNGQVYVNGNLLNEPYVKNNSLYRGNFQVPEESYFFLGDNREISTDSRSFEIPYITKRYIRGRVINIQKQI